MKGARSREPIGSLNAATRSGVWSGVATGAFTGDPQTAVYVATAMALLSGLGSWGRDHKQDPGLAGFFAHIFAGIGG